MQPLNLTLNPKLDVALADGWQAWEAAARIAGLSRTLAWAGQRAGSELPAEDLREYLSALLDAEDEETAVFARAELAELLEESDDELADSLWSGVLARGLAVADPDLIFEASSHLAAIAEELGDPLEAAEYFIDYLNWRRSPEGISDVESVQTAFEEVIRLAELDGERKIAAQFSYRQVRFAKIADMEAETATAGDWETEDAPYASWS
jgi:hypothetical protein